MFFVIAACALITAVSSFGDAATRPLRYYSDGGGTALTYFTSSNTSDNMSLWGFNTDSPVCENQIADSNGSSWLCLNRTGYYYCVGSTCTNITGGAGSNNYPTSLSFGVSGSTVTLNIARSGLSNISGSFVVPTSGGGGTVSLSGVPNGPLRLNATNSSVAETFNVTCDYPSGYALGALSNDSVCFQTLLPATAAATYYPLSNPSGYITGSAFSSLTSNFTGNQSLFNASISALQVSVDTLNSTSAKQTDLSSLVVNFTGNQSSFNASITNLQVRVNTINSTYALQTVLASLVTNFTGNQSLFNTTITDAQIAIRTINASSSGASLSSLTANFTGNQTLFNTTITDLQVALRTINNSYALQVYLNSLVVNFTGNQSLFNTSISTLQVRVDTLNTTSAKQSGLDSLVLNFTGNQSLFNTSIQTVQVRVDSLNSTKAGSNSSACPSGYYVSNVTTSFSGVSVTCALDQSGSGGGGGNMSEFIVSNGSVTSTVYNASTLSISAGSNIAVGLSGNTFTVSSTAAGGGPFDATNNLTANIRLGNYRLYTSNTGTAYMSASPSFAPRMYFNGGGEAIEWDNYQYILLANQYNELRTFNADTAGVNITNTGGGEAALYVDNEQVVQPWDERVYYQKTEWESVTTGIGIEPWVPTAQASGTTALVQGNYSHPGMATVSNALGTAAGSGYCYVITGATTFVLGPGYEFTYIGKPQFGGLNTLANGTTGRIGWFDVNGITPPTDALFWNVTVTNSTTWLYKPMSAAGGSRTELNGYNWTPITSYDFPRINIKILNNTLAVFSMYNSSRSLLYTANITSNIPVLPSQSTSNGVCFHATAGAAARVLAQHDFMSLGITGMNR